MNLCEICQYSQQFFSIVIKMPTPGFLKSNKTKTDDAEANRRSADMSVDKLVTGATPYPLPSNLAATRTFVLDEGFDPRAMEKALNEDLGEDQWRLEKGLANVQKTIISRGPQNKEAAAELYANEWLAKFKDLSEVLKPDKQTDEYPAPIKIALIDSGPSPDHLQSKGIIYMHDKGSTAGSENIQHEMLSVDVISEVFDRAQLYLANVDMPIMQKVEATVEQIAEAIQWAVEENVNIINIAITLKESVALPEMKVAMNNLRAAVDCAKMAGILIFAPATTSRGDINSIAYPAVMRNELFCIYSSDGRLGISETNPPASTSDNNFAILGECVRLGTRKATVTGTMVSSAIAAGVAGLILDFANQPDPPKKLGEGGFERLQSKEGMTAVFRLMSTYHKQSGYQCVAPWDLLPPGYDSQNEQFRTKTRERITRAIMKALQQ
ncbi:uncharacterized protein LY89DRAFT_778954 [Mollisia scopiformis]|uniref:Peptidase S8/S53 domain-containing protein n=1 Tax=Mollisia scopiformis TaxID=149040 RepID=A0A194XMR8_MOLSC|nr:uncharacterized protein LY89DRAFT_778954 [Mollisia scopiformis]KUJ21421.1 hypothetical protein LY89DRAFT_778954 [Mollisia scopiformis]